MNTYTRNMNQENQEFGKAAAENGKMTFAGFAAKISLLILLIFFAVYAQMYLRAGIERMNKQALAIQAHINQTKVKCTNLRNHREQLTSWENIQTKISQYRLGLRAANHRQVAHIPLDSQRTVRKNQPQVRTAERDSARPRSYARVER
ncbi:MAG: hypothetical protein J5806_00590 [Lentisphaeria bacterium]|nr:hypothetical protein [Lentisphaeria bacterium]